MLRNRTLHYYFSNRRRQIVPLVFILNPLCVVHFLPVSSVSLVQETTVKACSRAAFIAAYGVCKYRPWDICSVEL